MRGEAAFDQYYHGLFGARWASLKAALLNSEKQILRRNGFQSSVRSELQSLVRCEDLGWWQDPAQPHLPERGDENLLDVYIMDPASAFAARALQVQAGDRVLDLCAAPGGKTLILAEALRESGELICNDVSAERRERLKKVIQQYIPREVRDRVRIAGKDGVRFGLQEPAGYDCILLDAPCSGERHLLQNPSELAEWSPRRVEHLATRQYALLAGAALAVRPGGRILYSTCALSPTENDEVIGRLLKKKKGAYRVLSVEPPRGGEPTEFGVRFLPDQCGFGPIFYGLIERVQD